MNTESTNIISKKNEAHSLFKKFLFSEAIKSLNYIVSKEGEKDYRVFYLLGTSHIHKKNLDLAEKNLRISLKLNEKFHDTIYNLGVVLQLKENYLEAIKVFQMAFNLNPTNLETINQLAECNEKIKSYDNAKKFYHKALELEVTNKKASKGLGRIYLKFGYHKQGLEYVIKSSGLLRFNKNDFKIIS